VVFISTPGGFGSGFFVNESGLVLTNCHVIGDAKQVEVVLQDGRKLTGEVVERAANDVDLALVQVKVASAARLELDTGEVKIGQFVASVGHGDGAIWTFTTGMISNVHAAGDSQPVLQTQIPLNPGNSGGPVVDRRGRVLGIVTSGIKESNSINFAIRAEVAMRSLEKLAPISKALVVHAPDKVPVFLDGVLAGQGPLVLLLPKPGAHEVFAVVQGKMLKERVSYPAQQRVDLVGAPAR
jgi:S1-C subfamily serine protease